MNTREGETAGAAAFRRPSMIVMTIAVSLFAFGGTATIGGWRSMVPPTISTHFDLSGTPDGFTGYGWVLAAPLIAGAAALVVGFPLSLWGRDRRAIVISTGTVVGGEAFVVALMVILAGAHVGLDDPHAASLAWWTIPVALCVGALAGVAAAVAVMRAPADQS